MGVQVIEHQHDLLGFWVMDIHQSAQHVRKVLFGAMCTHRDMSPARERLKAHEQATHALPFIFVIVALNLSRPGWERHACFTDQLLTGFIQAHVWIARIIRRRVHVQYLFHLTHTGGIGLGRNAVLLFAPRFKFIFFSTCRTVSRPTRSTYPSSTILSANRPMVQWTCPDGAGEQ